MASPAALVLATPRLRALAGAAQRDFDANPPHFDVVSRSETVRVVLAEVSLAAGGVGPRRERPTRQDEGLGRVFIQEVPPF